MAQRKGFTGLLNGTRHIARRAVQKAIDHPAIRSRSGTLARLARYPNPLSAPWRRKIIDVLRRGAIGDVLMCTPALRELKQKNPTSYVRFYTNFPTLVRGLPYIDEVLAPDDLPNPSRPNNLVLLQYENAIPPRAHIAKIMGDNLGLNVRNVRPDCVIDFTAVNCFRKLWCKLPRPHIIVQRRASRWTPNKDWPEGYWFELIENLSQQTGVIEVGNLISNHKISAKNYIDLCDQTSLEELVAAIAAADILVGPISAPVHIAAAARIPAVVIYGGYEHPLNTSYTGNLSLYTPLACAPCWLREPCPYDLKCLKIIRPDTVAAAIWSSWRNHKLFSELT